MNLALAAFGPPQLTMEGGPAPAELTWRKHLALLVYLARSPGGARRRDHLVGLLWPEKDEAKARHSLNEACRAIRKTLGDDALETRGDTVALDLARLDADWADVEAALAARDTARLARLWRGDFLEGFGIPDATLFEDWLAAERARWRGAFRDALTAEADRLMRVGRHSEALALAARVLAADPSAEAALKVAMLAEALAGAAPGALARFDAYAAALRAAHDAAPAADLAAVAERIRAGGRHRAEPQKDRPAPIATPPLCGRERVLAALAARLAPTEPPRATVVLVGGGPGSGKSRLLREVAERRRLEGARLLQVTCVAADTTAPGSALGALVRRGLAEATGLAAAPPDALAVLAALDPEIARRYPGAAPRPADGAAALGRAVGEAIRAVAEEEGPVIVALDDAHLADPLSLDALAALLRAAELAPVTLLLAARTDGAVPPELTTLRGRIGHDVPGCEVAAAPLSDEEVAELTLALLPAYGDDERARLVRRLRKEAGGVPFFVVEILRALGGEGAGAMLWPAAGATTAHPLPFPVPGAVIAALTLRISALGPLPRAALVAAAVAGPRVEPAAVARLLETSEADVETRLHELERAGFLRDDGGPYLFAAELVRVFVMAEMLTSGERRRMQERLTAGLGDQPRLTRITRDT